jgi:hypothetical protein
MLDTIFVILGIYSLTYLIKESSILARPRHWLMMRSQFFAKMLYCFFCTGIHSGWIIYLLHETHWNVRSFVLWALAGGAISFILNAAVNRLMMVKVD